MIDWADPTVLDLGIAEAFARDPLLEKRLREIVKTHGIKTAIETGTWRGYTALRLSHFVGFLHTLENNRGLNRWAADLLKDATNAWAYWSESVDWLFINLPLELSPVLYYLDAHWGDNWPILDEIETIARLDPGPAVIVVHDCLVPDRPDFKFDSYKGVPLTFEYLKPALDKLPWKYRIEYNREVAAESHKVGVLFVLPE